MAVLFGCISRFLLFFLFLTILTTKKPYCSWWSSLKGRVQNSRSCCPCSCLFLQPFLFHLPSLCPHPCLCLLCLCLLPYPFLFPSPSPEQVQSGKNWVGVANDELQFVSRSFPLPFPFGAAGGPKSRCLQSVASCTLVLSPSWSCCLWQTANLVLVAFRPSSWNECNIVLIINVSRRKLEHQKHHPKHVYNKCRKVSQWWLILVWVPSTCLGVGLQMPDRDTNLNKTQTWRTGPEHHRTVYIINLAATIRKTIYIWDLGEHEGVNWKHVLCLLDVAKLGCLVNKSKCQAPAYADELLTARIRIQGFQLSCLSCHVTTSIDTNNDWEAKMFLQGKKHKRVEMIPEENAEALRIEASSNPTTTRKSLGKPWLGIERRRNQPW